MNINLYKIKPKKCNALYPKLRLMYDNTMSSYGNTKRQAIADMLYILKCEANDYDDYNEDYCTIKEGRELAYDELRSGLINAIENTEYHYVDFAIINYEEN